MDGGGADFSGGGCSEPSGGYSGGSATTAAADVTAVNCLGNEKAAGAPPQSYPVSPPSYAEGGNFTAYPSTYNTQGYPQGYPATVTTQPALPHEYYNPIAAYPHTTQIPMGANHITTTQVMTAPQPVIYDAPIDNNMGCSVLSLFCCLFIGIAAVVYSSQVNTLRYSDPALARRKAATARNLAITGIVLGIVLAVAVGVMRGVTYSSSSYYYSYK